MRLRRYIGSRDLESYRGYIARLYGFEKVDVPERRSGEWRVEKFVISEKEAEFENMRAAIGSSARVILPGQYTRLMRGHEVVMSDTPMEMLDHAYFVRRAHGNVLINGLGLGVVLRGCLNKETVSTVTVIEKSEDVLKFVTDSYRHDRVKIIHGDAFTWKPPQGMKFDCAWHDIWDVITTDNLPQMKTLHRRFGHWVGGYQGSWGRDLIKCER